MKRRLLFLPTLAFALLACQQTPTKQFKPIASIELTMNAQGKLTTSALLPNQNNPASSVAFTADTFNVATNGTKKFLIAKFKVSNNSGAALQDLTLVAYNKTGNQTATAIKNLQNFAGLSPAQLTSYAQSVTPSHGMNIATPPTVNSTVADMQIFSEAEVVNLTNDASSLLQGGEYLFPYGYVARDIAGTSRNIPTGTNTGFLTVGVQVPDNNEPNISLERFRMTFIAFTTPTASRVTESVEEQSTSSASVRKTDLAATELLTLGGSSTNTTTRECRVRAAGTASSPLTYLVDTFNTSNLTPSANSNTVSVTSSISITTDRNVPTLNTTDIKVRGSLTGDYTGTWAGAGSSLLTFTPSSSFKAGEQITVTLPSSIKWCEAKSWGFRATVGATSTTFAANTDYATGLNPTSVALGDLDGDGKLDMVTANSGSSTLSVLLGNGDGTFQANVEYSTGDSPISIALGDVNTDGKLDVVTASYNNSTSSVLLGNGDGTFQTNTNYTTGLNPASVALGDVNGDGKLDMVTANTNNNTSSVLLGNGDGTFQANVEYGAGDYPISIALGDVNGDGKLDVVTTNYLGNTSSVLLGNGDGTFQANVEYGAGDYPNTVALGDVNGDGKLDVVTTNYSGNTSSVLLGNGDGTFQANVEYGAGDYPNTVALGDVNADGKLDMVTTNYINNTSNVLLGNGDGTFQANVEYGVGNSPNAIALGDVNGDGKLDLVTANNGGDTSSVLLGNGDGTFQANVEYSTGMLPFSVALGDVDGDGKLDMVTANYLGNTSGVLLGQ